jgi:EF hand domain-containing protein
MPPDAGHYIKTRHPHPHDANRAAHRSMNMVSKWFGIVALALVGLTMPMPAHSAGITAESFIRKWDADHDGTLSLEEVRKAASARFDELDRDHDGTLDRKELGATMSPQELRQADIADNRTLDKNQYLALVERRFEAADKDRDGKLDKRELNSHAGRALLRLFGSRQGPLF